jgi:hypothetical protein
LDFVPVVAVAGHELRNPLNVFISPVSFCIGFPSGPAATFAES